MYTVHFGLTERPFQLTPDARYWFDSRSHKKAMAYLGYGIAQGEGFIVVTGEIGAGKSTLVAHLLQTIDRERLNAIALVSTQVEGDDVLRLVAQRIGIDTRGAAKAQLLDRIEAELGEQLRRGRRTLLVVDEAQNLPVSALEELRMLSNFQLRGQALIQIVLLGQPEFRDRLGGDGLEQLRQRVIATHHLEAMDPAEVEPYVRHRLAVAGWEGRPEFAPEAMEAIHRHTGGIPRRVNQLCGRLLLFAAVEGRETIDDADVDTVGADAANDAPQHGDAGERVLPLRVHRDSEPAAAPQPEPVRDLAVERRVAALEARLEEQERALRRVLTLLVDWVENERQGQSYRHNAA